MEICNTGLYNIAYFFDYTFRLEEKMAVKYVFVTGGVVSGLGKGITAASLGRLLKARGFSVTMQKFDPYINIDPGTMNPIQHGEVFVTDDGAETDLDLGHYERFIDESLNKNSNVTTGKIYWSVLQKERRGDFGGGTVQVIPHITNEIKSRFFRDYSTDETKIAIIEVGGTVGDIESQPFLEAIRQFQHEVGHENAILIHVTLIPYLKGSMGMLHLDCPEPDLDEWRAMCKAWKNPTKKVTVALVGKYIQLHDAYISVVEALKHGGVYNSCDVTIKWIDSETVTPETADELLSDVSGILVPGGFGDRGTEGKIEAIRYAREHNIPFLGLCLGMQLSIVEFARNVIGYDDAHSVELNPNTTHPVIHLMPDQEGIDDIGGTLRLGSYPCVLDKTSKAYELYGEELIHERHRHRYEVNNDYRKVLTENGMMLSGISPDGRIVEMIELKNHPWFIATQAHPELKSRPNRPHPLFRGFITAALEYQNKNH